MQVYYLHHILQYCPGSGSACVGSASQAVQCGTIKLKVVDVPRCKAVQQNGWSFALGLLGMLFIYFYIHSLPFFAH